MREREREIIYCRYVQDVRDVHSNVSLPDRREIIEEACQQ